MAVVAGEFSQPVVDQLEQDVGQDDADREQHAQDDQQDAELALSPEMNGGVQGHAIS